MRRATSPRSAACARSTSWPASRAASRSIASAAASRSCAGRLAVGAPGNLGGWCEMVSRYGKKKLPELFAPAIRIARDGFGLIEFNVEEIRGVTGELRGQSALYPEWSRNYLDGLVRRPAGARRRAEAARPRRHARGAGQRRPRPALWRRARQEDDRTADRARRLPHHGRPRRLQGRVGRSGVGRPIAAARSTCRRRPARRSSTW